MLSNQLSRRLPHWVVPVLGSLMMMPILSTAPDLSKLSTQQFQSQSNPNQTTAALAIVALGAGVIGLSWNANRSTPSSTNRSLHRNLLSLLHNDYQAANRLVQQVHAKHPERSLDWCVEKVIYDLKRDRR